jgi:hypothetical protein
VKCPCLHEGNTRDHGIMCHYAGMVYNPTCTQAPGGGVSVKIVHDGRLCVSVCAAHYAWRETTSRMFGPCRCGAGEVHA